MTFSANLIAVAGGISYTGVDQTTPFGAAATAIGNGTAPTVTLSSAVGELVVDTAGIRQNTTGNQTLTAGSGQTQRYNDVSGTASNSNVRGAGSEKAGAASVTMSWTAASTGAWAIVAAPLKPASSCATLLTFNSKYVVTSATAVTTTSATLVDDTQASQTFSLTATQTVLVIYQANNLYSAAMEWHGLQNAINVDGGDVAVSWDSPFNNNFIARNTVFWIGTLGSGSHTIKGRFASNTSGSTATLSERGLLIYILDGNAFRYLDRAATSNNTTTTFIDDSATFTFTPPGTCKALILYNVANAGATENSFGKKAAINVGGTDYSQAEKPGAADSCANSVFTLLAGSLPASSIKVTGRFAGNATGTALINRRQLGVLMFDDATLLDTVSSDTQVTTTSSTLVNDGEATINRTTTEAR